MDYLLSTWRWAWYEKNKAKKWARLTMFAMLLVNMLAMLILLFLTFYGK